MAHLGSQARLAALVVCIALPGHLAGAGNGAPSPNLDLPIVATTERYAPYDDFCSRVPQACLLQGETVLPYDPQLMQDLQQTSATINAAVRFALDKDTYSVEDYWALPESGQGDCEDIALAKREHLVDLGYPSAALRLAFVFSHAGYSAHCILTVETSHGTFLLDSRTDAVMLWAEAPYNFETRERPDGRWDRFDQSGWRYDHPVGQPR